jgi:hypothetical protein
MLFTEKTGHRQCQTVIITTGVAFILAYYSTGSDSVVSRMTIGNLIYDMNCLPGFAGDYPD